MQDPCRRVGRAVGNSSEVRANPLSARCRTSANTFGEAAESGEGQVVRGVRQAVVAGISANQGLSQEQERQNIRAGFKKYILLHLKNKSILIQKLIG